MSTERKSRNTFSNGHQIDKQKQSFEHMFRECIQSCIPTSNIFEIFNLTTNIKERLLESDWQVKDAIELEEMLYNNFKTARGTVIKDKQGEYDDSVMPRQAENIYNAFIGILAASFSNSNRQKDEGQKSIVSNNRKKVLTALEQYFTSVLQQANSTNWISASDVQEDANARTKAAETIADIAHTSDVESFASTMVAAANQWKDLVMQQVNVEGFHSAEENKKAKIMLCYRRLCAEMFAIASQKQSQQVFRSIWEGCALP